MSSTEEKENNSDGETSRLSEESSSKEETKTTALTATIASVVVQNNNKNKPALNSLPIETSPPPSITSPLQQSVPLISTTSSSSSSASESDDMKRANAKKLIERYFYQLSDGCGKPNCGNKNCASSGEVVTLSPNQAAARAIQLYTQEAELCELHPSKVPRTQSECNIGSSGSGSGTSIAGSSSNLGSVEDVTSRKTNQSNDPNVPSSSSSSAYSGCLPPLSMYNNHSQSMLSPSSSTRSSIVPSLKNYSNEDNVSWLDEDKLNKLIDECIETGDGIPLTRNLGKCFSSRESVARSFQRVPTTHIDKMLEKAPKDLKNLKKEDFRTLEGDLDKDEDSSDLKKPPQRLPQYTSVDLDSLRRSMERLCTAKLDPSINVLNTLNIALSSLSMSCRIDLQLLASQPEQIEEIITVFVIIFEIAVIGEFDFMDGSLPAICKAASHLHTWAQARLARIWAEHSKTILSKLLNICQQLISLEVVSRLYDHNAYVQDNELIACVTKVMKIIYYANILAGSLESTKLREEVSALAPLSPIPEDEPFSGYMASKKSKSALFEDKLAISLDINVLDSRKPYIPFEEFYNEPLSDTIEMDNDYLNYKNRHVATNSSKFCFMLYSFILTPATKTLALYYDSRIRMYSERRMSMYHTRIAGQPQNPYLNVKVRREKIIDDALIDLEIIAINNPKDLKKQLVVEFMGEQGIDEGGLSKEFFQLVVEQIFNADYGMFIEQEDTKTVWFNATSFENEAQFTLIGIVLGLAIYNNIILAVNFPMVVYRKLMGVKGGFSDLEDWNPVLHKSLLSLLEYEGQDMEDVFMQTFKISYKDVFGNILYQELKPNGDTIFVNQDNKQEFVDLYTDFLLNTSVLKQFRAFRRGFEMVTDESPLHLLFRPEEIELLVCGSKHFDFNELQKAADYEGGYTDKSETIVNFWSIVHALPEELKKKLLEFTTGSDRVPVGGLSRLKIVIARNGPDSDRLPTSHTCFNVLLLPEYCDKQKLEDRLLKAISYSKGFGML